MAKADVRAAIYCRKSVEKGLDQDFNSLDAQREACAAYITSQKGAGWIQADHTYEDGGFTGANTDRPALRDLLADIDAGHIDVVVVYKADRLSRSLLDFTKLLRQLEEADVAFVSVTEQFNTTSPAGRLMLNMLASFAEYERAIIAERTRDKIRAARRKGKWTGGIPMLGYDVHPDGGRLVVNEAEALRVQAVFDLYLEVGTLASTAREMKGRGWGRKVWTNRRGGQSGGGWFTKETLRRMLTSPLYIGKVAQDGRLLDGEHDGIVDQDLWEAVQRQLQANGFKKAASFRNAHGAFLRGLLYCAPCGRPMRHAPTRKGNKVYRYYVCGGAQDGGWQTCPVKSVAAGDLEAAVLEEIRERVQDPDLLVATVEEARRLRETKLRQLDREIQIAGMQADGVRRLQRLQEQRARLADTPLTAADLAPELAAFTPLWDALTHAEQAELAALLVERVDYDGSELAIVFKDSEVARAVGP